MVVFVRWDLGWWTCGGGNVQMGQTTGHSPTVPVLSARQASALHCACFLWGGELNHVPLQLAQLCRFRGVSMPMPVFVGEYGCESNVWQRGVHVYDDGRHLCKIRNVLDNERRRSRA